MSTGGSRGHIYVMADECKHEKMQRPVFDPERAAELDGWHDVRLYFPRYQGSCPDCGEFLTVYADERHKAAGRW